MGRASDVRLRSVTKIPVTNSFQGQIRSRKAEEGHTIPACSSRTRLPRLQNKDRWQGLPTPCALFNQVMHDTCAPIPSANYNNVSLRWKRWSAAIAVDRADLFTPIGREAIRRWKFLAAMIGRRHSRYWSKMSAASEVSNVLKYLVQREGYSRLGTSRSTK